MDEEADEAEVEVEVALLARVEVVLLPRHLVAANEAAAQTNPIQTLRILLRGTNCFSVLFIFYKIKELNFFRNRKTSLADCGLPQRLSDAIDTAITEDFSVFEKLNVGSELDITKLEEYIHNTDVVLIIVTDQYVKFVNYLCEIHQLLMRNSSTA